MQSTILEVYRHNLYHECFTRAADALFELADALLTDAGADSLIELSQAACFRRGWPSLYAALEDGQIDRTALIRVFTELLPHGLVGDTILGIVEVQACRLERQPLATLRVGGEERAQVNILDLLVMRRKRLPGRALRQRRLMRGHKLPLL